SLLRARAHEARLRPRDPRALSVLLLRRRVPAAPRARAVSTRFELIAQDGGARLGRLVTAHGPVETPAFMPVGTAATVKGMRAADISMVLDECTAFPATEDEARRSMERSLSWAERCKRAFTARPGYGLFGIVQGGIYRELRRRSAEGSAAIGFDGYAVGGLA